MLFLSFPSCLRLKFDLSGFLYEGFDTFNFLSAHATQHRVGLLARHGGEGPMISDIHPPQLLALQSTYLGEEADDVHLVDLVLAAFADVEGSPEGLRNSRPPLPLARRIFSPSASSIWPFSIRLIRLWG